MLPKNYRVAVLYYSQTGQSQRIAESLQTTYAQRGDEGVLIPIQAKKPFSFPWKMGEFFAQMPYCVEGIPTEIHEINYRDFQEVDRVVIIHPVWFLSPSRPVQMFLTSPDIEYFLRGKKVVQILTCRNMWFSAARQTRDLIRAAGGKYHGQIALEDPSPNWASLVTTPRWMFSGKKEAFAIFPAAGLSENNYSEFQRSGVTQMEKLFATKPCCPTDEVSMDRAKSLSLCLEVFGRRFIFKPWAKIILGAPEFLRGLLLVGFRLNLVLFLLVTIPLAEIVSRLARAPFRSFARKQQLSLRGSA